MTAPITQAMKRQELARAYPSWPVRFEAFRFSAPPVVVQMLESIIGEATEAGEEDWRREAQYALDTLLDDAADFTTVEDLIRQQDKAEELHERHYAYEVRHGREVPYDTAIQWEAGV